MKTMNKMRISGLVILLAIFTMPAMSQGGRGQGGGPGQGPGQGRMTEEGVKERVQRLAQNLELSDKQTKQLTDFEVDLFKKNEVEIQKLRDAGDREAMREFMMEQREIRNAKYKEILTEEQYEKFKEQQGTRRQNRPDRPGQGDGERAPRGR